MREFLGYGVGRALELGYLARITGGIEQGAGATGKGHRGTYVAKGYLNIVGVRYPFEVGGQAGNRDARGSSGDQKENNGGSERQLNLFPRLHSSPNEDFNSGASPGPDDNTSDSSSSAALEGCTVTGQGERPKGCKPRRLRKKEQKQFL